MSAAKDDETKVNKIDALRTQLLSQGLYFQKPGDQPLDPQEQEKLFDTVNSEYDAATEVRAAVAPGEKPVYLDELKARLNQKGKKSD